MKNTPLWIGMVILMSTGGCEDIVEVPDISNQTVSILAPVWGSILATNTVRFNWEEIEEATSYEVQVATPAFETATQIVLDTVVRKDTLGIIQTQIEQSLDNGDYAWRVKAFNSDYETAYTLSHFQVNGNANVRLTPHNTPQLTIPTGEVIQTIDP